MTELEASLTTLLATELTCAALDTLVTLLLAIEETGGTTTIALLILEAEILDSATGKLLAAVLLNTALARELLLITLLLAFGLLTADELLEASLATGTLLAATELGAIELATTAIEDSLELLDEPGPLIRSSVV